MHENLWVILACSGQCTLPGHTASRIRRTGRLLHGSGLHSQNRSNLPVRLALSDRTQHLGFTRCESRRIAHSIVRGCQLLFEENHIGSGLQQQTEDQSFAVSFAHQRRLHCWSIAFPAQVGSLFAQPSQEFVREVPIFGGCCVSPRQRTFPERYRSSWLPTRATDPTTDFQSVYDVSLH